MNLQIHKKGQGTWARGAAYALGAILVLFGAYSLYTIINVPNRAVLAGDLPVLGTISVYHLVAVVVGLLGLLALHLVLNKPAAVDLLADTEQEMKRVSWPSRPEVQNATVVVVLVTLVVGLLLSLYDAVLEWLFGLVY